MIMVIDLLAIDIENNAYWLDGIERNLEQVIELLTAIRAKHRAKWLEEVKSGKYKEKKKKPLKDVVV